MHGAATRPSAAPRRESGASSPGTAGTAARNVFAGHGSILAWLGDVVGTLVGRPTPSRPSSVVAVYRTFFGLLGRWTAWISETSYTVSFVIMILAIASGMIGRHALAAWACGVIITLNLVGLAGDVASLVTLSFRRNPVQGTLFLLPPFTFYYLWSDWQRYRDTIVRMRTPLFTLIAVGAAYVFVPWLGRGGKEDGRIAAVKRTIDTLEERVTGRKDAIDEGLKQARSWLREVPLPDPSSLPGLPEALRPASGRRP